MIAIGSKQAEAGPRALSFFYLGSLYQAAWIEKVRLSFKYDAVKKNKHNPRKGFLETNCLSWEKK